jgi:hypothetical protein
VAFVDSEAKVKSGVSLFGSELPRREGSEKAGEGDAQPTLLARQRAPNSQWLEEKKKSKNYRVFPGLLWDLLFCFRGKFGREHSGVVVATQLGRISVQTSTGARETRADTELPNVNSRTSAQSRITL